jgi:hypothetical protein
MQLTSRGFGKISEARRDGKSNVRRGWLAKLCATRTPTYRSKDSSMCGQWRAWESRKMPRRDRGKSRGKVEGDARADSGLFIKLYEIACARFRSRAGEDEMRPTVEHISHERRAGCRMYVKRARVYVKLVSRSLKLKPSNAENLVLRNVRVASSEFCSCSAEFLKSEIGRFGTL